MILVVVAVLSIQGCRGECSLEEEPATNAELPFTEAAVLTRLATYSPTEIVWELGPSGSTASTASIALEKSGEAFVRQHRHANGSMCGDASKTMIMPVTVDTSVAEGQVTQHANLLLFATGDALENMRLEVEGTEAYTLDSEATVDGGWAAGCATDNPEVFRSPPYAFWMLYGGGMEQMSVTIAGASDAEFGVCWQGTLSIE